MSHEQDQLFARRLAERIGEPAVADIGCGRDKFPGAVGVDVMDHPGIVDVIHDLDRLPWPLADESFDLVLCNHLIEHVEDFTGMMGEFHRILRPGGYLIARTPHYSHVDSYVDPTHRRHLTTHSLDYFVAGCSEAGLYSEGLFELEEVKLSFGSGPFSGAGRLLARLSMRKYEKYWCRLFPATTLTFRLRRRLAGE